MRDALWNAYDERHRSEMHQMERGLVLHQLDAAWKNHLYTMDHLRSGIGLKRSPERTGNDGTDGNEQHQTHKCHRCQRPLVPPHELAKPIRD